jgi:cytochrome P450
VIDRLRRLLQRRADHGREFAACHRRRPCSDGLHPRPAANRDPAHFPDAECFDISRLPGKHLSFGYGPHGCLGATLAREQARIALATLFRRMPGLQLDRRQPIQWYRNAGNRGPITLPLVF